MQCSGLCGEVLRIYNPDTDFPAALPLTCRELVGKQPLILLTFLDLLQEMAEEVTIPSRGVIITFTQECTNSEVVAEKLQNLELWFGGFIIIIIKNPIIS